MNKLEALRLEVDSRRRTVAKLGKKASAGQRQHSLPVRGRAPSLGSKTASPNRSAAACCRSVLTSCLMLSHVAQVDSQRAKLPQTRAKGEYEMENTIKVLQHKESKLSATRQSYKEHEALVYHQVGGEREGGGGCGWSGATKRGQAAANLVPCRQM